MQRHKEVFSKGPKIEPLKTNPWVLDLTTMKNEKFIKDTAFAEKGRADMA